MNLMQLAKLVLDDEYAAIDLPEPEKDEKIRKEIQRLTAAYLGLNRREGEPIDYSDPVTRYAYIYKYTVAHADYIMQLINRCPDLQAALRAPQVEVSCLGGGPGSDLLGVLKFLMQKEVKEVRLTCYLFDKERAWADSWSNVAPRLDHPIRLNPVFLQFVSLILWRFA